MAFISPSMFIVWLSLSVVFAVLAPVESQCPSGWLTLYEKSPNQNPACYKFYHAVKKTFDAAQQYCQEQGGYLARDTSLILSFTDKWYVSTASAKIMSVACQRDYNNVTSKTSPPPAQTKCAPAWYTYAAKGTCLYLSYALMNQSQARQACRNLNGDLVKIENGNMDGFIKGLILKRRSSYWIGLNDFKNENTFVWNDETTKANFTLWDQNEPNDYLGNEDCVIIEAVNYKWNDYRCNAKFRFICQRPPSKIPTTLSPPTALPTTTPTPSANCGAGWEEDKSSPYCYKFQTDRQIWNDAGTACTKAGGQLASIHSSDEQSYITGRTASISGLLWIGANDIYSEGGWRWSDNGPFAFFNWDDGNGKNSYSRDCVAMMTGTGKWSALNCYQKYGYICKKIGQRKPSTIAPKTSPAKIPAGSKWGCPPGWIPYKFSCYIFQIFPNGVSWRDARKYCQTKQSAELASISDANENSLVLSKIPSSYRGHTHGGFSFFRRRIYHQYGLWIGLSDFAKENTFTWTDSSKVTFTKWDTNEPNNNGDEDCVFMKTLTGRWNDADCDTSKQNLALCRKSKSILETTSNMLQDGCQQGHYGYGSKCYVFINQGGQTYKSAESFCVSFRGHLATVNNNYVQSFLTPFLSQQTKGKAYWIGLSSTSASHNKYVWTSGATVDYTNWAWGHTGREQVAYVAMQVKAPTGLWIIKNSASDILPFICELPRSGGYTDPPTVATTTTNITCPTGWLIQGTMCYQVFAPTQLDQLMSWKEARHQCGSLAAGGTLATIGNNNVSSLIAESIHSQNLDRTKGYWIGLNDQNTEGGYVWEDGSAFTSFNQWGPREPNGGGPSEDCVEWKFPSSTGNGEWNDQNCYLASYYICQFPRGSPLFTAAPTFSVGPTGGQCDGSAWYLYNNNCYYLSPEYADNSSVSWFEARELCHSEGAELTSIPDGKVNGYLTTLISKHQTNDFWIGMNDIDSGVHRWVDKSTTFYWGFGKGEPNDRDGQERCVEFTSFGRWNDQNCQDKKGFICKRLPGNVHPTYPLTTIPKGGCPSGYSTHDLARYCYKVHGTGSDGVNFDRATAICGALATGGTLASIHNDFEEDFLMTLISNLAKPAWIGLTNKHERRRYQWLDNSHPTYDNWAPDAPKKFDKNIFYYISYSQRCVVILNGKRYSGKWQDGGCHSKYPYICQSPKNVILPRQKPNTVDCNAGYGRFGNSCYKYVTSSNTWDQAEKLCKADGGHLASLTNSYENAFFNILTVTSQTSVWLGLKYKKAIALYRWSDGWPVIYAPWGVDQPKRLDGGGCVSSNMSTLWEDTSCLSNLTFVCEVNLGTPPSPTGWQYGVCDAGWTALNGYCYLAQQTIKNSRAWARTDCRSKGGELASLLSLNEAKLVNTPFSNSSYVWIGLLNGITTGYKWDDGSPVDFTHFKDPSSPDNDEGKHEECIAASTSTTYWIRVDCSESHGYFCKKLQKGGTTTTPTTTTVRTNRKHTTANAIPITTQSTMITEVVIETDLPTTTSASKTNSVTDIKLASTSEKVFTSSKPQKSSNISDSQAGMSGGAVAGVVIGVVIVIAIAILAVLFVKQGYARNLKNRFSPSSPPQPSTGIENVMYSATDENQVTLHSCA